MADVNAKDFLFGKYDYSSPGEEVDGPIKKLLKKKEKKVAPPQEKVEYPAKPITLGGSPPKKEYIAKPISLGGSQQDVVQTPEPVVNPKAAQPVGQEQTQEALPQEEEDSTESGWGSDYAGYIPAIATPLLIGLLGGQVGPAASVAGKTILDLEKEKMSLLKEKLKSNKGSDMSKGWRQVYEQGTNRVGRYNVYTGGPVMAYNEKTGKEEPKPDFQARQYIPVQEDMRRRQEEEGKQKRLANKIVNLESGTYVVNPFTKTQTKVGIKGMNPVQASSALNAYTVMDRSTGPSLKALESVKTLYDELELDNPVSMKAAIYSLAKSKDPGGRLAKDDVQMFGGSKALDEMINQFVKDIESNTFTKNNLKFFLDVGAVNERRQLINIKKKVDGVFERYKTKVGEENLDTFKSGLYNGLGIDLSDANLTQQEYIDKYSKPKLKQILEKRGELRSNGDKVIINGMEYMGDTILKNGKRVPTRMGAKQPNNWKKVE